MKKKLTRCTFKKYTVFQFKPSIGVSRQQLDNLQNYQHGQYDKKKTCKNPTQFDLLQTLHYCAESHSQPNTKHL